MRLVVADASALLEYLLRTEFAAAIESTVRAPDADLHVPAQCDVEVAAGLRRGMQRSVLSKERLALAVEDYLDLPVTRHGHQRIVTRILDLRDNFSAYDAAYVALAEQLRAELLTADELLARAARQHTGLTVPAIG